MFKWSDESSALSSGLAVGKPIPGTIYILIRVKDHETIACVHINLYMAWWRLIVIMFGNMAQKLDAQNLISIKRLISFLIGKKYRYMCISGPVAKVHTRNIGHIKIKNGFYSERIISCIMLNLVVYIPLFIISLPFPRFRKKSKIY